MKLYSYIVMNIFGLKSCSAIDCYSNFFKSYDQFVQFRFYSAQKQRFTGVKKTLQHRCFPVSFVKLFSEHLRVIAFILLC